MLFPYLCKNFSNMFSKPCEYAIRATIYIFNQTHDKDTKVGIKEVATEIQSPEPFTAKILQTLSRQGIVSSTKGPNGGFYLTSQQGKASLFEIMQAVEGPKILRGCILGLERCDEDHPCPLHEEYKGIKAKMLRMLSTNTIESLSTKITAGDAFLISMTEIMQ